MRLKNLFKRVIAALLALFRTELVLQAELASLRRQPPLRVSEFDVMFIRSQQHIAANQLSAWLPFSRAQLRQDLFALGAVGFDTPSFFVEFGACDGLRFSNTFLLEKHFHWSGIVAEPARGWHEALADTRNCTIDKRCVWSRTGETVDFRETETRELSTIDAFAESDHHGASRQAISSYTVKTVSLADLLDEHEAPQKIGYLSMDTEGSEFEILKDFEFDRYSFGAISVEHNFTPNRDKTLSLLEDNGYRRVHEDVSAFDDWFIPAEKINVLNHAQRAG